MFSKYVIQLTSVHSKTFQTRFTMSEHAKKTTNDTTDASSSAANQGSSALKASKSKKKARSGHCKSKPGPELTKWKPDTWPKGGRTSIEHYELAEIRAGTLDPLFRIFWKDRYRFYSEQGPAISEQGPAMKKAKKNANN